MQEVAAYVLSKDGRPLMPMHSYSRVKHFLKEEKAVLKSKKPYVIQLTYDLPEEVLQEITLGIDPGRTNIGACAITNDGDVLYSATVETRNKEIPKLMSDRKAHRKASRSGERKVRQRKAKANKTTFKDGETRERILPKCEEPITVHYITNTESKFANRKREEGWLTPTANQLLQTHINVIELIEDILPITDVVLEINRFDFVKMENPGVRNWEYQKGKLWSFGSVEEAVYARQDGHCIFCKKPIDHYHHIIPKSKGGSESVDNRAGVCKKHHDLVHKDAKVEERLRSKQAGVLKKYHALSIINQIMPKLIAAIAEKYDNFFVTEGYDTYKMRKKFDLPKLHYVDAWCIANSSVNSNKFPKFKAYTIKQFRRQNRAIINNQRERTYKLDGVVVAKNRKKRIEQKTDSLYEWYQAQIAAIGETEARKLLNKLEVIKSTRRYNDPNRPMPGSIFIYNKKGYIYSGQLSNGQYYRALGDNKTNYPARDCEIVTKNKGLVYI